MVLLHLFPLWFLSIVLLAESFYAFADKATEAMQLTYGSAVHLIHLPTNYKLVASEAVWGSGSGQKAVTVASDAAISAETSALWIIKEPHADLPKRTGETLHCGDTIRLEHGGSAKNLHSHPIRSAISGQNEVSAFGEDGAGDKSDNFVVECASLSNGSILYAQKPFYLKHAALGGYLKSQRSKEFTRSNCPRCPIMGHLEAIVTTDSGRLTADMKWKATAGLIFRFDDPSYSAATRGADEL